MCLCCLTTNIMAQNNSTKKNIAQTDSLKCDSIKTKSKIPIVKLDSLTMEYIDDIYRYVQFLYRQTNVPQIHRYKMYKTEHSYHHIKLDTGTGRVWQVQFGADVEDMTSVIDDESLLFDNEPIIEGRFELYPTNYMNNFILLDTETGRTWEVQWHTNPDKRFRQRTY